MRSLFHPDPKPAPEPMLAREAAYSAVTDAIYELIEARRASFTIEEALSLPPVVRGLSLISGLAASFLPLAYRGGVALPVQPRILTKPDPFRTRQEFLSQTVLALIKDGESFWFHPAADRDPESGKPRQAIVIPNAEVKVEWDQRRMRPLYEWRSLRLVLGVDITHVAIGRRAGELHGHSPIRDGLDYLAPIAAAEQYAKDWFASGGVPPVVIKALQELADGEADRVKQRWMDSREVNAAPAVIGNKFELQFPPVSPQTGQMQESRAYGATVVARLLGIPAALLLVETSGATITYTNPSGAVEDLVKSTVVPTYLNPIEAAFSDLVPSTQAVRFDLADMERSDLAGRMNIYKIAIDAGILTAAEARAFEGWGPVEIDSSHEFDPVPDPEATVPSEVPAA